VVTGSGSDLLPGIHRTDRTDGTDGTNRTDRTDRTIRTITGVPMMRPSMEGLFYKNGSTENSVRHLRRLFEDLAPTHRVYAEYELDQVGMISLHNHMNSASTWKSVSQWDSGICYTVDHPQGELKMFDRNRGQNTRIYRETVTEEMTGSTPDRGIEFSLFRTNQDPVDFSTTSCHSSRYTWVKIESRKTFRYESERSSWEFGLSVIWEGGTKECAESSSKRYMVDVTMASADKASRDPGYTAASFMEKIMDTLFQRSSPRHVVFFDKR
jgi:hypothetical protein